MTISNVNQTGESLNRWRYTATGGETSVSGLDDNGASLSYTTGTEQVYVNGVMLVRTVDYTASTGTSITSLTALVASDVVEVLSLNTTVFSGMVPLTAYTAKGDLTVGSSAGVVVTKNVGTDGQVLTAASGSTGGVNWSSTLSGVTLNGAVLDYPVEGWYINSAAFAGYTAYLQTNNAVHYLTGTSTASGTLNITYASGTTLNSVMTTGQAITFSLLITNSTAYYANAYQIDGSATGVTVKWTGGTAPSSGNASAVDVYQFTVLKTGSATFTVFAAGPVKYAQKRAQITCRYFLQYLQVEQVKPQ